ncbi:MoaD/ThiS family protein [Caldisphaera lagunensis]|nr:MoaD/ThiS family protein [Caldisphaera lagunensis]
MKINILFGGIYSQMAKFDKATIEIDTNYIDMEKLIYIIKENFKIDIKNDIEKGQALILVNGRNIKYIDKIKLNEGDFISLLPPVKGGKS